MGNMMDYVRWRGDLPFERDPFNEVDNLLLSYFSYVLFDDQVPGIGEPFLPLHEISEKYFRDHSEEELTSVTLFTKEAPFLMREMAASARFGDLPAGNFIDEFSEEDSKQFAALEVRLPDGSSYVSFRGTDDTLIAWKEDLNLSTGVVPAEEDAAAYLNRIAPLSSGPLYIGGHSKGGNLAVYAAAKAIPTVKERIVTVFSNDGPGFIDELIRSDDFVSILGKVRRFVPGGSIIGMVLNHTASPTYIQSSQKGLMEHDGFSWQMEGNHFCYLSESNATADALNRSLRTWIDSVDDEQKNIFIDDVYGLLSAGGAKTLSDLQENKLKTFWNITRDLDNLSEDTKEVAQCLFRIMLEDFEESLPFKEAILRFTENAKAGTESLVGKISKLLNLQEKPDKTEEAKNETANDAAKTDRSNEPAEKPEASDKNE